MNIDTANNWCFFACGVRGVEPAGLNMQQMRIRKFVEYGIGYRPSCCGVDVKLLRGGVDGPFEINDVIFVKIGVECPEKHGGAKNNPKQSDPHFAKEMTG